MGRASQGDPLGRRKKQPATLTEVEEAIDYARATAVHIRDQAEAFARDNNGYWPALATVKYEAAHRYLDYLLSEREGVLERERRENGGK